MRLKDEAKRKDIIDYTIGLVYSKGIAGVKMAVVAEKTRLSPGTLYIYFKNKEDLILSIYSELMKEQQGFSIEYLQSDLPYKFKLQKIWLQWIDFSINNHKEIHFINQVKSSPYAKKLENTPEASENNHFISLLFEEGRSQGLIKEVDNLILANILKAFLNETADMILKKQIKPNEENLDMMFSLAWDAVRK